jgi:hypothetical protein
MSGNTAIQRLDGSAVLRIVSYLTERMRDEMTDEERGAIQSADEARSVMAAFLESNGIASSTSLSEVLADEAAAAEQGRALLQLFWEDQSLRLTVEEMISNPPGDSQKAVVELALATAVILGGLVSWLQTKIEIDVVRKDGKTDFRFALRKEMTSDELIKNVAEPIKKIVLRG